MPAIVLRGREETLLWTEDVSYRGVFLGTDEPMSTRQLVRVRVLLPPDSQEVTLHAMAVYAVRPDAPRGRVPGVGFQFYAMDARTRARWDEFIAYAKEYHPEASGHAIASRGSSHATATLQIVADDVTRAAIVAYTDEASMFVRTDDAWELGTEVALEMVHPRTGASFPLSASVARNVFEKELRGVGLTLRGFDQTLRDEVLAFLETGALVPDIFIDEDDPRFA